MNSFGLKSLQSSNIFGRKNGDVVSGFGKKGISTHRNHNKMFDYNNHPKEKEYHSPLEKR